MPIQLNHTIVRSQDKQVAARFLSETSTTAGAACTGKIPAATSSRSSRVPTAAETARTRETWQTAAP